MVQRKTHTHKKKTVSKTQNHSYANTHTHTHTQLYTYQITNMGKADQSKHTTGKRNKDPYINQLDQTKVIYTGNKSEFKFY